MAVLYLHFFFWKIASNYIKSFLIWPAFFNKVTELGSLKNQILGGERILIGSWFSFKAKAGLIFFSVTVCQHTNIIQVHPKWWF